MPEYVIKMDYVSSEKAGYFGKVLWDASEFKDAKIFNSMKEARKIASRLSDRFRYKNVEIEKL